MLKLIVHIGAHKTGTTALQKHFADKRSALRQHGVYYPKSNWYHHAQHRLAFALKANRDPAKGDVPEIDVEISKLARAAAAIDSGTVFISSEELFSAGEEAIASFKAALDTHLPQASVQILAMVRRPDELLLSMYNQKAKQPGNTFTRPLPSFVEDPASLDPDMRQRQCIDRWSAAFGQGNMALLEYEAGDTIAQVAAFLDLPEELRSADKEGRANPSVSGVVIEIMRLAKLTGMAPEKQTALFRQAIKIFAQDRRTQLPAEERQRILRAFEEDNEALFAGFGRANPYRADIIKPAEEEAPQPNLTFRELMKLIDALL